MSINLKTLLHVVGSYHFKSGQTDTRCRKCGQEDETQQHLVKCLALSDFSLVDGTPSYDDLFGAKPRTIGLILKHKFKMLITPCAPVSAATTNTVVDLEDK